MMLRSKERIWHVIFELMIVLSTSLLSYLFDLRAAIICLLGGSMIIGLNDYYEKKRYHKLNELATYLHQVCMGNASLDIRDNEEGELSILKNEIYKVTQRLSEQSEMLRKDKRYLANAISDISHQLKTPLTSMLVMMDLLKEDNLQEDKRLEFIRTVNRQLNRIEWLVTALLKLSKIDAGTVQFKKEKVIVLDLIKKALEPLMIKAELKGQSISLEGKSDVSFIGDTNWTSEALINILKNGIEHTGKNGEIKVSFSENPLYTEIIISDQGEGISSEDLPHIFERFYRGKNASNESVGIGLAMARSIIVQQNGDITVYSEQQVGTEFKIRLYKGTI